jgi:hypothetical protein
MTPDQFDAALSAIGWKGTDFCDRAGLVPNTVWRWRKGTTTIPLWVGEYLRALLALQRLHAEFLAPRPRGAASAGGDDQAEDQAEEEAASAGV